MPIKVFIEPGKVVSWGQFRTNYPKYSIALDGFVNEPTARDSEGPYANFDHHSHVDRLSTLSTAAQVHMEINLDLFKTFQKDKKPKANLYINDCDEDTALAVWLLQNHERVIHHADPLINKLVYCNDKLDCTAGSYPFGDIKQLRVMAWVFEPYQKARSDGALHKATAGTMRTILEATLARITQYSLGNSEELHLEGSYEVIGGGATWAMVTESSTTARMFMFHKGIDSFVSVLGNGRYVLGKKSMWTKFPILKLYEALNSAEKPGIITPTNRWGGSNTIGGSPRETGSSLTPKEIETVVSSVL